MIHNANISMDKQVYYRLIALWVLSEGVMGGIIHGFKLPVSGLVVGSSAVICICLMAYYVPVKGAILRATIIVAIFKMMLSPHTPLPAYFAVFFQGLAGELLFFNRKSYKFSCLLLGIIALLESAGQRVLVMTILYGSNFWKAFNVFANGLTSNSSVDYVVIIISLYFLLHLVAGIAVGWFAANLPVRSAKWQVQEQALITAGPLTVMPERPFRVKRRKGIKTALLLVWMVLIALFFQSYFEIGRPLLPAHLSLQIFIRSLLIVLTWYFFISPLLTRLFKHWLQKKQSQAGSGIDEVLNLLPSTHHILYKSWQLSSSYKGILRLSRFCEIVLINTLKKQDG